MNYGSCVVARSDNIRADIERLRSMSDEDFHARWAEWCFNNDRDVDLMRARWIGDLEYALPFAEREDSACADLVDAKDAYREEPTEENRQWRDQCVDYVLSIRAEERADRRRLFIGGDAFVSGV